MINHRMDKNLYELLELNNDCSLNDIIKSYRRLVKVYHPDKLTGDAEKFKEINIAYNILSNIKKREEYDKMNNINKKTLFHHIMELLKESNIQDITKNIINFIKTNNFNIDIKVDDLNISEYDSSASISDNIKHYNKCSVKVSLDEIYEKKYKKIQIKRKENDTTKIDELIIPIIDKQIIYEKMGDKYNDIENDLIINIKIKKHKDYQIINTFDLLTIKYISIYELIMGFKMYINLFNEIIEININKPIFELTKDNDKLYHIIKNKGLPTSYYNDIRGDLYIEIIIDTPIGYNHIIERYFPPINSRL